MLRYSYLSTDPITHCTPACDLFHAWLAPRRSHIFLYGYSLCQCRPAFSAIIDSIVRICCFRWKWRTCKSEASTSRGLSVLEGDIAAILQGRVHFPGFISFQCACPCEPPPPAVLRRTGGEGSAACYNPSSAVAAARIVTGWATMLEALTVRGNIWQLLEVQNPVCTRSTGTFAVAMASGAVQVLTILRSSLADTGAAAPLLARPQADACADAPSMGSSLVSALDWLATAPHDLLLVRSLPYPCKEIKTFAAPQATARCSSFRLWPLTCVQMTSTSVLNCL